MLDLSILIVNWNTAGLLDQCLKSIFDTTEGISFEIIVIDNASSDGSPDMVRKKYPSVKLIENESNLGFAKANNRGIAESGGRYVVLLNSDTIALDGAFERMVRWMDANETCGACGPMLLNGDGSLQPSWAGMPTVWSEIKGIHDRRIDGKDFSTLSVEELSRVEPFETDWVGGACLMARGSVIERIGPMDEGYFMYCEETDWCWRMRRAGFSVFYVPQASVIHLGGESSRRAPLKTVLREEYSRHRLLWRTDGWVKCALGCPVLAAKHALRAIVRSVGIVGKK